MEMVLPMGSSPKPLEFPHFPSRLHVFVWRNWGMIPVESIASVLETTTDKVVTIAESMGLSANSGVDGRWLERGYVSLIRRNWHLLPYEQLLQILGWTQEKLAYSLKEDDFLWVKLGMLKPAAERLLYHEPSKEEQKRCCEIKLLMLKQFGELDALPSARHFDFLDGIAQPFGHLTQCDNKISDEDSVILDDSWRIECPEGGKTGEYARLFAEGYLKAAGFRIPVCDNSLQRERKIVFRKLAKGRMTSESHIIEADNGVISISACDDEGILRGLQWIGRQACSNNGRIRKGTVKRNTMFDLRMVHTYFGASGDILLDERLDPYPDWYLEVLSGLGINAIWLQGVLYKLVPFYFEPHLSENHEKRIRNLEKLAKRAAVYGIGVYLYLNEPRAMPHAFFDKYPYLRGSAEGDLSALCTSQKEVRDYLAGGVRRLFEEAPSLAGIFTITMSENLTNCYSRAHVSDRQFKGNPIGCPRCRERQPEDVVAEVNRIIYEAAVSVKPTARVLCWTWGWDSSWGLKAIKLLPKGVELMSISEEAIHANIGRTETEVIDYSMSIVGPGERASGYWDAAAARGMKTVAKVQLNNTWECSAVPYLPVGRLVKQHLENLRNHGVTGLMLSWTLGGYPSGNLETASQYYWEEEYKGKSCEKAERGSRGTDSERMIQNAIDKFSEAFTEFPFCIQSLYLAPQNVGPMNLLFANRTGYSASMVGYPYDDLDGWRGVFSREVFEEQWMKLSVKWKTGLEILEKAVKENRQDERLTDLWNVAFAANCHFRSTFLQTAFIRARDELSSLPTGTGSVAGDIPQKLLKIISEEIGIARSLYSAASRDSRIGFEASNHYYYTLQDLKEKVLNCEYLKKYYTDFVTVQTGG